MVRGGVDVRYAGPVARRWVRLAYRLGSLAGRYRVSQGALTASALVFTLFVPVAAAGAGQWPWLAALLVVLGLLASSTADATVVLSEAGSRLIGFYRTLVDRIGELCWLATAWILGGSTALVAICAVLVITYEYVRLRVRIAGVRPAVSGTVGDRPARVVIVLIMLLIAGAVAGLTQDLAPGTTTVLLAVWALLGVFGLVQMFDIARKALR